MLTRVLLDISCSVQASRYLDTALGGLRRAIKDNMRQVGDTKEGRNEKLELKSSGAS
jgi:hypothetical protein